MSIKDSVSGHTEVACLIGSPVAHSLSPALHNASFKETDTDAVFVAFEVQPEALSTVVPALRELKVRGYSVTMPLKQKICSYLDELTPAARLMNAVNTVVNKDGKSIGDNTDGAGFVENCRNNGFDPTGKTVTLVGAGGAASAIITQLALENVERLFVFNRQDEFYHRQNEHLTLLAKETSSELIMHPLDDEEMLATCIAQSDLFINATRVGMAPLQDECIIDPSLLHDHLTVADVVYEPKETLLLHYAKERGLTAISGLGMLLQQAAISEKIWFDIDMPVESIQKQFFD